MDRASPDERALVGQQIGPYQITSLLGRGGMGEVYRARDARLDRDVAIKVLPARYTADVERLRRLEREAKLLATLNHPNIAAIYGFEETDGIRALVLELVEGETLAERVRRHPLRVEEALQIGRQIADALDAAHRKGIIHRDLKPANVKITPEGLVKVLDFGLAKELAPDPGRTALFESVEDAIVGTASYMSPEQARGDAVDARTDIWGLGCVLYEMFTGNRAFSGDSFADVVAGILSREPDFAALPAGVPSPIRKTLTRMFAKDRRSRLSSSADVRLEIDDVLAGTVEPSEPAAISRVPLERLAWFLAVVILLAAWLAPLDLWPRRQGETVRIPVTYPPNSFSPSLQTVRPLISPDGRRVAFRIGTTLGDFLAVRSLDELDARIIRGSQGALQHFWSPDSRFLAFVSGKLKKVDLNGGDPQIIGNTDPVFGGTWSRDGVIVLGSDRGGLRRVAADTGISTPLTAIDPAGTDTSHERPSFLPDGRHLLFVAMPSRTLYVTSVKGGAPKRLLENVVSAHYSPPGHLLYDRDGGLFAQPFDSSRLELTGSAFPIVSSTTRLSDGAFSVSAQGSLAYANAGADLKQFVWVDRFGRLLEKIEPPGTYVYFDLSNDGHRLVASEHISPPGGHKLFVRDFARGESPRRLNLPSTSDTDPRWSPDNRFIAFASNREGSKEIVVWDGQTGKMSTVFGKRGVNYSLDDWTADGSGLLIHRDNDSGLLGLPLGGNAAPNPVLAIPPGKLIDQPEFSPDGRWIAYNSDETGMDQIFVSSYPATSVRWQVSTAGGRQPRWRMDGRELFYLALDGSMMSVSVDPTGDFRSGTANRLFQTELPVVTRSEQYSVAENGQRFLFLRPAIGIPARVTVVLNWFSEFAGN